MPTPTLNSKSKSKPKPKADFEDSPKAKRYPRTVKDHQGRTWTLKHPPRTRVSDGMKFAAEYVLKGTARTGFPALHDVLEIENGAKLTRVDMRFYA